jgi:4,5-dihydroxyphthalate decarboxylase
MPKPLRTLLGDYPGTAALKSGAVSSTSVSLNFVQAMPPNSLFQRVVRTSEFDIAELAIATFLSAKAVEKPLVLLPFTVLGRHQHTTLAHNPTHRDLRPGDLEGCRVGIRAWSVTTAMWVRGILMHDHGINLDAVEWVTFEEPHVAECVDPPNAVRAPAGKNIVDMLVAGELDAAVLGAAPASDSPLRPMFVDAEDAGRDWCRRQGAVPVNHLVVANAELARTKPETIREVYRLLAASRAANHAIVEQGLDLLPMGVEALAPSLELAIRYAGEQGLLARPLTVDDLFDETTRLL